MRRVHQPKVTSCVARFYALGVGLVIATGCIAWNLAFRRLGFYTLGDGLVIDTGISWR